MQFEEERHSSRSSISPGHSCSDSRFPAHSDPQPTGSSPAASRDALALVYACSGCSGAAQMANDLAVRLDRSGLAQMSCIAGIGGDVPALIRMARAGEVIMVIDGCRLNCARRCLERHVIGVHMHIDLSVEGVRKMIGEDASADELQAIWERVILPRIERLPLAV